MLFEVVVVVVVVGGVIDDDDDDDNVAFQLLRPGGGGDDDVEHDDEGDVNDNAHFHGNAHAFKVVATNRDMYPAQHRTSSP